MRKLIFDNKINFLFLFISFACVTCVVGLDNISFNSIKWLHDGDESTFNQVGWYFFKNDVWRFPVGNNPNYGDELGLSIVFSDSIIILALFFKLFKFFIPENFQYFSFWYFICFYLQLFFSFKILKKFTESELYSFIGSLFFLIAPIFIYRVDYHVSLSAQWLLLLALYLGLTSEISKNQKLWFGLIILSSLIEFYFTGMICVIYVISRLSNYYFKKESLVKIIKDFFIIFPVLLLILYVIGYFEIRVTDSLGLAFGKYKLNLLSIFDPVNTVKNISWSWFLPDIKLPAGDEVEGFNYLGLGQIVMVLFSLCLFLYKRGEIIFFSTEQNQRIKLFLIISLLFTLWALSNQISFGHHTLLEIPINKYIFGLFSILGTTGRMFWVVNYFLLILSLVIIFKCFKGKGSLIIIVFFLIIQTVDISAGLKNYINPFSHQSKIFSLKDEIWNNLFDRYKIIKTTYPVNWSRLFGKFSYSMEKHNIEKTNLVIFGRGNRKLAAEARYNLYDDFRKKKLSSNTIYLIDGLGHLRHLKNLFKNDDIGFFYRDNVWFMVKNEKKLMNENDLNKFAEISPKLLEINEDKILNFSENDNYYGFGWSHNSGKTGIWSEGKISTLFFKTEKNYGSIKLHILCKPYISRISNVVEFDIYVNNSLNQKVRLSTKNDSKIEILINQKDLKNNEIKIDFAFEDLISPHEALESPDSRKLGILMKNIKFISI